MISKYFLDRLGVTKTDFTKFVKTRRLRRVENALLNLLSAGHGEPDRHSVDSSNSCCGVGELRDLVGASQQDINKHVAEGLLYYRGLIYYSIHSNTTRKLQKVGFNVVDSFRNPNTGRRIQVCVLNPIE